MTPPVFDRKLECDYAGNDYAPGSCAVGLPAAHAQSVGLIPAIQSADPGKVVLYEPPQPSSEGVPSAVGALGLPFENVALSFHVYGASSQEEQETIATLKAAREHTATKQPGGPATK